MTTLDSIGFTVLAGVGVCLVSFTSFGCALRFRSINIAPRCTARSPDTIYSVHATRPKARKLKDNDDVGLIQRDELQYRGNCIWGWIPWTLSLPYETLLKGVPGTGTRKGGVDGSLLKVNLDGIIMIKFHAMCLKVALLATVLCIGISLPINYTACFWNETLTKECTVQLNFTSLTNFEKTTLAAVPQIIPRTNEIFASTIAPSILLARFYTIVLVSWFLYFFTIRLLQREWVENLALRRVYYLEADHWSLRSNDLRETEFSDSDSDHGDKQQGEREKYTDEKRYRNNRDPWIPHPEMRETVPNIELYSVLVGNLPSSLSEILYDPTDNLAENLTKKEITEWQLKVTAAFFDKCVPRPPGFSSSVAAITILPDAPDLAAAWRKWYHHAVMVRKLRLVRSLLARMRHFEIPDIDEDEGTSTQDQMNTDTGISALGSSTKRISNDDSAKGGDLSNFEAHLNYFRNVFGSRFDGGRLDGDVMHLLDEASMFGPEQIAAYARESAHSAAGCCTYGCCEERVRALNIDKLATLEREMAFRAEQTYENLKKLQNTYVTKPIDSSGNDAQYLQSDHKNSEGLNLRPETRRLSQLTKRKQKIYPPQINVPKNISDMEQALSREELSPFSWSSSLRPTENDRSGVGFRSTADTRDSPDNILASSYLGDTKWGSFQRSPRVSIDVGNQDSNLSPRLRLNTDWSHMSIQSSNGGTKKESQWNQVERLVQNDADAMGIARREVVTGAWKKPIIFDFKSSSVNIAAKISLWAKFRTKAAVKTVIGVSNFAVVTFTSRQAAIAARKCLADGRGYNRFRIIRDLPIPPLADAAVCDITDCRGCCRPVTITHSSKLQFARKFIARTIMIGMYIFWAVPIQFAVSLVDLTQLYGIWPFLRDVATDNPFLNRLISGFVPALLFTSFFATAPHIFRALANFGSNAISIHQAEFFAMKYYWWFMLITAFSLGSSIATIILNAINQRRLLNRLLDNESFTGVLVQIAQTLPTQVSATWLNWIIFRTLMTLPLQYMLQINTFLFQCLGWKCCRRCLNGGGPGGPIPYRIYIDSGVVFLCTIALSPICPLLAPASALYFLFCIPLWRRNCIFIYRPTFDSGGSLWPFLSDVCLTSMIFAQVFLTVIMALKKAVGPAVLAALPIIFVLAYRRVSRKRFLKAYMDAALFQASLLDCWDSSFPTNHEKREEYRKFLVDSHKAAYVPICMAVGETTCLTTEPAEVIPYEEDEPTLEAAQGSLQSNF